MMPGSGSGRVDMAKKRDAGRNEDKALSRRDFVTQGAVAGARAAVLSAPASAQPSPSTPALQWNYEADVVVLGAGCVGLHAAVRARDLGASVIVLEQNFDVGGKLVHSGGWTSLGGGDAIQKRDSAGSGPPRLRLTPPLGKPGDLYDDFHRLFFGVSHLSVVDSPRRSRYPLHQPR